MEALGREVLARLDLTGDEFVLDAGCGSGRITEALLEQLPRGRVIGVDQSASMVDAARQRLGPGVDLRVIDLLELELEEPLDAILSTATFHWISDHDLLFRRLRAALRSGGRIAAQCGGEGNITILRGKVARCSHSSRTPSTSRTGARRGTTPHRMTLASACSRRVSAQPGAGSPRRRANRSTRASSSRRSCSAPTSSGCPRGYASGSWTT